MTLCNMAIESGATTGLCPPDETTFSYLRGRENQPSGDAFERKVAAWRALQADPDATYDREITLDVADCGRSSPGERTPANRRRSTAPFRPAPSAASLEYMGLAPGVAMRSLETRSSLHRLVHQLAPLRLARRRRRSARADRKVPTIVTPGSQAVKRAAEREGLHDVFQDAGALWTHSSCGPCLGMSMGVIAPGARCISSTNRNFPGRMGAGGRVHLASPAVVAASAVLGRIAGPEERRGGRGRSGRA